MLRKAIVVTALLAGGVMLAGASMGDTNMIDTKDAKVSGESIVFPMVKAAKKGYLVIHAVKDGKVVAPASIGHTAVKAGDNPNVKVRVDGGAHTGTDYVAMLHDETNNNSKYEFGPGSTSVDTPSMGADGKVVATMFKIAK